jgi:uncharacterized membrane protein YdbT with pleckstrin-like domain
MRFIFYASAIASGVLIILITEIIRRSNKYFLTDRRIIHEFTLLSRKTSTVPYEKIRSLDFKQTLIERIFGIGTICIDTAGLGYADVEFKGISDPLGIKKLIEGMMVPEQSVPLKK